MSVKRHYVFFPIIHCPTVYSPTGPAPTRIAILTIAQMGTLMPNYTYPDQGIRVRNRAYFLEIIISMFKFFLAKYYIP